MCRCVRLWALCLCEGVGWGWGVGLDVVWVWSTGVVIGRFYPGVCLLDSCSLRGHEH